MLENREVCRICLGEQPTVNIFNNDILKKIHIFCKIQMFENDGLPSNICFTCANTLEIIVDFKKKCEESNEILKKKLNSGHPIKIESTTKESDEPVILYDVPLIKQEIHSNDEDDCDAKISCTSISHGHNEMKIISNNNDVSERNLGNNKQNKNFKIKFGDINRNIDTSNLFNSNEESTMINKKTKNNKSTKESNKKIVNRKIFTGVCPFCGLTFPKNLFYIHLITHEDERYKCDICDKYLKSKRHLGLHIKTHNEKECPCSVCGKLFKTTYEAYRHAETVHKRSNAAECSVCGKKLATLPILKKHLKIHTGEKAYECDICKQKFTFGYTLTLHKRTHTGEKPYGCRFCDARFSVKKTLTEHERLHTGETPYYCPACNKGFSQLSNMKSHFRYNHKELEFINHYSRANERHKKVVL